MSLIEHIKEFSKINFNSVNIANDEFEINVSKDNLIDLITFLKDDPSCMFEQLSDMTAIDYPKNDKRFLIIYQLLSINNNLRIRLCCDISEEQTLPSISKIYNSAVWAERELWDMFGIFVENHPDLRRLLTDYGFLGHPLRKDFPLTGNVEVSYDVENRRVIYDKVKLMQDYREFDFTSPWGVSDSSKKLG